MQIDRRWVEQSAAVVPDAAAVSHFATQQPGIVRFLNEKLPVQRDGEAFAVALELAWTIHRAFETGAGRMPRVSSALLHRHEANIVRQIEAPRGVVAQLELCEWASAAIAEYPACLTSARELAQTLWVVIQALDDVSMGANA